MTPPYWQKAKSQLMKVEEESEKVGLKLNIQTKKFMSSGPVTWRQIKEETMETVKDFIFLGSKLFTFLAPQLFLAVDGDCSHEIKRHMLHGRKVMTNLDSILKGRDITLPTKVNLVKAMFFPAFMYGWMWEFDKKETSAPKNWCFWIVVLEKTLESPLDCKSILREINTEYWMEGLMLKLKL